MTFYLKYRPQKIEDLDIQSVRESLTNIVLSKNIPHAFLFAGPKGTGKTSAARILAKIINCQKLDNNEPCGLCSNCLSITNGSNLDIIELDAASNRGIDDIRSLKESINLAPTKSKAKVYIIDEAHMLTQEASNALLKTLEEPPSHVYFILATTNPEKLIETIKSRTILINFTKATIEETKRSLQRIIKQEKVKIDDELINTIIKLSKGSFRDAVKLLEQHLKDESFIKNQKVIDVEKFVEKIINKQKDEALKELENYLSLGIQVENLTEEILQKLQKKLTTEKDKLEIATLIEIILHFQEYKKISPIEELPLQLAVVKWCNS